jgi:hypothetical protein
LDTDWFKGTLNAHVPLELENQHTDPDYQIPDKCKFSLEQRLDEYVRAINDEFAMHGPNSIGNDQAPNNINVEDGDIVRTEGGSKVVNSSFNMFSKLNVEQLYARRTLVKAGTGSNQEGASNQLSQKALANINKFKFAGIGIGEIDVRHTKPSEDGKYYVKPKYMSEQVMLDVVIGTPITPIGDGDKSVYGHIGIPLDQYAKLIATCRAHLDCATFMTDSVNMGYAWLTSTLGGGSSKMSVTVPVTDSTTGKMKLLRCPSSEINPNRIPTIFKPKYVKTVRSSSGGPPKSVFEWVKGRACVKLGMKIPKDDFTANGDILSAYITMHITDILFTSRVSAKVVLNRGVESDQTNITDDNDLLAEITHSMQKLTAAPHSVRSETKGDSISRTAAGLY